MAFELHLRVASFDVSGRNTAPYEFISIVCKQEGFAQPSQMAKPLAELPDDGLREFVEWCYVTGMRKSEAASLRWSCVSDTELTVPGECCKSGEPHTIQFGGMLPAIVAKRRARRAFGVNGTTQLSEFVFHRNGEPIQEFRASGFSARRPPASMTCDGVPCGISCARV